MAILMCNDSGLLVSTQTQSSPSFDEREERERGRANAYIACEQQMLHCLTGHLPCNIHVHVYGMQKDTTCGD